MKYVSFETLLGQVLVRVDNLDDEIIFYTETRDRYKLYHSQDCCESVLVEDVIGDLDDLLGHPITMAEEASYHNEDPEGVSSKESAYRESWTWTFYKLATVKGYVTIRWYGESNGYYSERVDFVKLND